MKGEDGKGKGRRWEGGRVKMGRGRVRMGRGKGREKEEGRGKVGKVGLGNVT